MRTNYPKIGYVMTRHKHLLAGKDRLLFDDWEPNVRKFSRAGGNAVLVPAVHNQFKRHSPIGTVVSALRVLGY